MSEPERETNEVWIHITAPDHTVRRLTMKSEGLTIGRAPDNDISIDDTNLSRHHARIDTDGQQLRVTDLNSTNGTFLGNIRLQPNQPEVWSMGVVLRAGETRLSQESGVTAPEHIAATQVAELPSAARAADVTLNQFVPGIDLIGLQVDQARLTITPGEPTVIKATLSNRSNVESNYRLSIQGVPAEWVDAPVGTLRVKPDSLQVIDITLQPPRAPTSKAGRHTLTLRAQVVGKPGQVAETTVTLTLAAFTQFDSELLTPRLKSGQRSQVRISNLGNTPESFTVSWEEAGSAIEFIPPQVQVNIPPGKQSLAESQLNLKSAPLIGGERDLGYLIRITTTSRQVERLSGKLVSVGVFPAWVLPAGLMACLLLVIFSIAGAIFFLRPDQNVPQTEIAGLVDTQMAATRTAVWATGDDDRDGLTNQQEAQLNTLPDKRDTDEDGLDDGEEVARKTFPLIADTDRDGLKDGEEVARGLDPLNRDTDQDGLGDAVDPDPGRAPTATATSSPTHTATNTAPATPTVTRTLTPSATHTNTPVITSTHTNTPVNTNTPTPTPTRTATPTHVSPSSVTITGPNVGTVNQSHLFSAVVNPNNTTLPITYVWEASNVISQTHSSVNNVLDTVNFSWSITGTQSITITAICLGGTVVDNYAILIQPQPLVVLQIFYDLFQPVDFYHGLITVRW